MYSSLKGTKKAAPKAALNFGSPGLALEYMGPAKVKDGLYLGDEFASRDFDFVLFNKVNRIVNCSHKFIYNSFERMGVQYLNLPWTNSKVNLDLKTVEQIVAFVEAAMDEGESCLLVSLHGHSRAITVAACYFMRKYNWTCAKTMKYLETKFPVEIRPHCLEALRKLQASLVEPSDSWSAECREEEEEVLRNTFLNLKVEVPAGRREAPPRKQKSVKWNDQFKKEARESPPPKVINNVRGNCINITVNNFIVGGEDKKKKGWKEEELVRYEQIASQEEHKRPHSSDMRGRKPREEEPKPALPLKPKKKKPGSDLMMYIKPKSTAPKARRKEEGEQLIVTNGLKKEAKEAPFYSTWKS